MLTNGLRSSLRLLRREPGLSLLCVLTLSLGIALCTTLFSILQGVIFRPLRVEGGDRLYSIGLNRPFGEGSSWLVDPALFAAWRERQGAVEHLAAFRMHYAFVSGDHGTRTYGAAEVTPEFFELLGVTPLVGRTFEPGEGEDPVALVSSQVWRDLFEGDAPVIGASLVIDRQPRTVVGVLPADFAFPVNQHVWLPARLPSSVTPGTEEPVLVIGKLRPGTSRGQARDELTAAITVAPELRKLRQGEGTKVAIEPYVVAHTDQRFRLAATPMLGAVLGVLLIACSNVTVLFLARAVRRSRQAAIAVAVGATRSRLVAQVFVESLVLSLLGGAVGLALAGGGVALFNRIMEPSDFLQGFWIDVRLDPQAVLFVLALTVLTAVLAGILPALWVSATDPGRALRGGGTGGISGRSASRKGRALVIAELAVTCALLIAAALMAQTIFSLRSVDPGFDEHGVLTGRVSIAQRPNSDPASSLRFFRELDARLERLPNVRRVAFASTMPTRGSFWGDVEIEGGQDAEPQRTRWLVVSPGFFDVFDVGLIEGRDFEPIDILTPEVAIVNQTFADRFMDGDHVLGRRLRLQHVREGRWFAVVGVVPDLLMGTVGDKRSEAAVYLPHMALPRASMEVAVKTHGSPISIARVLEREVADTDPLATSFYIMTMEEILNRRHWVYDAFARLFAVFGLVAFALSTIGLYGTLSYNSRSRLREYGVRLALGARPIDLLRGVVQMALVQVGIGLLLGIVLAALLAKLLSTLLFGVTPWSLSAYVLVAALMFGAGLAAAIRPARRAARTDPTAVLRSL